VPHDPPNNPVTGKLVTGQAEADILTKAMKSELKAAFSAFCLNLASGTSLEVASQEFGGRLSIIKTAYDRALIIAKTEFSA
jgi:hypothetical protein